MVSSPWWEELLVVAGVMGTVWLIQWAYPEKSAKIEADFDAAISKIEKSLTPKWLRSDNDIETAEIVACPAGTDSAVICIPQRWRSDTTVELIACPAGTPPTHVCIKRLPAKE